MLIWVSVCLLYTPFCSIREFGLLMVPLVSTPTSWLVARMTCFQHTRKSIRAKLNHSDSVVTDWMQRDFICMSRMLNINDIMTCINVCYNSTPRFDLLQYFTNLYSIEHILVTLENTEAIWQKTCIQWHGLEAPVNTTESSSREYNDLQIISKAIGCSYNRRC